MDAQQYSLGLVKFKFKTGMPELQQRQGCRDGHSVGYELIRKGNRPIGTGRDETVVPVTSRRGGSRAFSSPRWLGIALQDCVVEAAGL